MRKVERPPIQEFMVNQNRIVMPHWHRWFDQIARNMDEVRKSPDAIYTADHTLTTDDFGKLIIFNIGVSNVVCRLMTVTARDLYCWVTIYRLGTGRLTITADPAVQIEYSSVGGSIYCDEQRRAAANVTLELVTTTLWGITGGTGLWKAD